MKNILVKGLFLCSLISLQACVTSKYQAGERAYQNRNFLKAINKYSAVHKSGDERYEVLKKIGDSYYYLKDYQEAEKYYKQHLGEKPNDVNTLFQLALVLKLQGNCLDGLAYLNKYQEIKQEKDPEFLNNFCGELTTRGKLYELEKENTLANYNYFNPIIKEEKMFFLSKEQGKENFDVFTVNKDGKGEVVKLPGSVNTSFNEGPFDFDTDGTMYITKQQTKFDELIYGKDMVVQLEIVKAKKTPQGWIVFEPFEYNNNNYSVGHPTISHDGKYLVFVSNNPKTKSETDLYLCTKNEATKKWDEPVLLEAPINTMFKEMTPSFGKDKNGYVLHFASDRPSAHGGLDVYSVPFNGETWGELYQHPFPINSSSNDYGLIYNEAGAKPMLVSDREVRADAFDVFSFEMANKITGVLKDENDQPIANAELNVMHVQTGRQQKTTTDENGMYELKVVPGQDYKMEANIEGFEPILAEFTSSLDFKPVIFELNLTATAIQKPIVMSEVYFAYDKAAIDEHNSSDLTKLLNTINYYPSIVIEIQGHTDARGSAKYNQALSERRAKAVVNWLLKNDVHPSRLRFSGYGETELVNNCADGVKCSEKEHALNRRTSFKVLSNDYTEVK